MLKRSRLHFLFLITPLALAGCGLLPFGGGDETAIDPAATPVPAAPAGAGTEGTDFADPLVEGGNPPAALNPGVAEGLIPLASEDAAARLAQSGRSDPFATLPIDEATLAQQGGQAAATVATPLPTLPTLPPLPNFQIPGELFAQEPEDAPEDAPFDPFNPQGDAPFSPDLPDLPTPQLAEGLRVTGVVIVKGIAHAIVEGEGLKSTYVREGDYLLNGQVLVKRIEASKGGPAFVIFEELGLEVYKGVGEGGSETGLT